MPYITPSRREDIGRVQNDQLYPHRVETPGELNYAFTRIIQSYLDGKYGESYERYNAVIGALECAKLELYRRMIVPYEKLKIKENGDVY